MGVRALGLRVALPRRLRMVRVRRPVTSMGNQFETPASAEHGLIQNELSQAFTSLRFPGNWLKIVLTRLADQACFTGVDV